MSILCVSGLFVLAASSLMGQVPKPAPVSSPSHIRSQQDLELEREIRKRFAASKISRNKFEVRVSDGVAYLTGRTDVSQHKGTATRLARLAGASEVRNRISYVGGQQRSEPRTKRRSEPRRVRVRWVERDRGRKDAP